MYELSVVLGVLIATARRSDLAALPTLRFRGLWFCFLAFPLKLALFQLGAHGVGFVVTYGIWLQLSVTVILLALVAINLHLPGMPVVLVGLMANLLVIAANGGKMPATRAALEISGQPETTPILVARQDPGHILADAQTRLTLLSDWIPLAALNHKVVSPGDIVAALGLTITIGFAIPPRQRRLPSSTLPPSQ
jgi:hypothetical protein